MEEQREAPAGRDLARDFQREAANPIHGAVPAAADAHDPAAPAVEALAPGPAAPASSLPPRLDQVSSLFNSSAFA